MGTFMDDLTERRTDMINFKDYDGKPLCQCFDCFDVPDNVDILNSTIQMKDKTDSSIYIDFKNAKYLSYHGTTFAKIDECGIIRGLYD